MAGWYLNGEGGESVDAKKFGEFIAQCRKEKDMTQADLAIKINVTDKAVSRWERGRGFPDINTLEPLACALGISVLELMKSEKITTDAVTSKEATEVVTDTLNVAKQQRKQERKNAISILGILFVLVIFVLFLDSVQWQMDQFIFSVIGVAFPLFCLCGFVALIGFGIWRKVTGKPGAQTFILALALLCALILVLGFFFLIGALGIGPVSN